MCTLFTPHLTNHTIFQFSDLALEVVYIYAKCHDGNVVLMDGAVFVLILFLHMFITNSLCNLCNDNRKTLETLITNEKAALPK